MDRYLEPLYGTGSRLVPRMAALVPDGHPAIDSEWVAELDALADIVWSLELRAGWLRRAKERIEEGAYVLVRGEPQPAALRELKAELREGSNAVLFASARAQAAWNDLTDPGGFRAEHRWVSIP